jgi:hypothetical protein
MSFDLRKNRVRGYKVMLHYDGFRRGGAPISMAPEVILPRPGPDAFLIYEKNDEWAVGIVMHELLSAVGVCAFRDMEHPRSFSDQTYLGEQAGVT